MKHVTDFSLARKRGRLISMVTCYDFWTAKIVQQSNVDCILVGDSAAMVVHGFGNTIPATNEMMVTHLRAVSKGAPDKLVIGDFPFLSNRKGITFSMETADRLMKAGAQAVKIEGFKGNEKVIQSLVEAGVPVMGHLGLTPQSVHALGGFQVQARKGKAADRLLAESKALEDLGCFGIVLEAIPVDVARRVTEVLEIPTIGIGAGPYTSGQVLVLQDLLGMNPDFKPKFTRFYLDGAKLIQEALDCYADDVTMGEFPSAEETYE